MTPSSKSWLTRLALVACLATALAACGGGQGDSSSGAAPSPDESASGPTAGAVDTGTTVTTWATASTVTKPPVTPGAWKEGGPEDASFKLLKESPHFAFYSDEAVPDADLAAAAQTLESAWHNMFDAGLLMPEPYANTADKIKLAIHIHSDWGANGGGWEDESGRVRLGMWIATDVLTDPWILAHEFTHGWQTWMSSNGGLDCDEPNTCGWIWESHANFIARQMPGNQQSVHCSEMLVNAPHVYLGSTRDRYCNWQFMEFLKDKYGIEAVTKIWSTAGTDPFTTMQTSRGWTIEQLNDFIGDWAMHNVTWDYKTTPDAFRAGYGNITLADRAERMHRLMPLEALDDKWATNRRFVSPFYGAPQRFGYNVVRLYPTAGATTVRVKFRGIDQAGSDAGFRWGLVATNADFTSARYSALQKGLDGDLTFTVNAGEPLFLLVAATPSAFKTITWDQDYNTIWRYPYMIELGNAWPQGFQNGQRDACPSGTVRHANGGGCASSGTATSVYVGPYATVLPGAQVSGNARIEDHAIVVKGTVSGGTVGGLSIVGTTDANGFNVSGSAQVRTSFYPLGFFEANQGASGTLSLYGDVEYRGDGLNLDAGDRSGFVDASSTVGSATDINQKTGRAWRP